MFVTWLPLPAFESKAEESLGAKHPATWESLVVEWWVMVALVVGQLKVLSFSP